MFIYFEERDREIEFEWGRGRPRERETQNPKQAPGSELSAQSLTWSLNSLTRGDGDLSQSWTLN